MRTPGTRIVLVSERAGGPRVGSAAHPQLRGLLARDYAGFTEPAAPPHDLVSPATAAVGIVLKLHDSDWHPSELLIGARDFCIAHPIPVGASAHPNMQQWLTPLGAYRLLGGLPMDALSGQIVDLTDVLGAGIRHLADRLRETPSERQQFALLDAYLLQWTQDGPEPAPEVTWAWRRLMTTGGNIPIHRLADEVGWSHKHLISRFRQQVGLPPKTAARLVRFDAVWRRLANHPPGRWDELAVESGYADQAHLIRDFRQFTGASPTEFPSHPQAGATRKTWGARRCRTDAG
ncbi:helix-turn-helix domain-containing protein [Mycobacterium sp. 21AC1]|uniref:AraC family transcriptional regulator n=1 Tax=[Mycobacterium] appelbergii TaxID=2939269 RepID=UPI002938EF00|nr:helix-turn-helix domain-containing protein [Mycobacterium sp. 21AC1]MDV3129116.1 helix-turn-helix domain-containing protein [Mycobacterium sp. 21AC1]